MHVDRKCWGSEEVDLSYNPRRVTSCQWVITVTTIAWAKIDIDYIPNSFLKRVRVMAMEDPFSALASLWLRSRQINAPALPDSFLGGSAPQLQTLSLLWRSISSTNKPPFVYP